jgi:hypothetical protein
VQISKQGGVADAIASATTPSLAQEDAIKLLTNLMINGILELNVDFLKIINIYVQERLGLSCKKLI